MDRRIWGRISSVNVQKVVWCCDELSLDYERVDAGGTYGIVATPEYLAKNPNGLVPLLEEGAFLLTESNAIVRYLAATHGEASMWPRDLRARADVDRWMEWQATEYTPGMTQAFRQLIRTPAAQRDAQAIETSRGRCETLTRLLDRHLEGREFLAAGSFTPADIVVGCAVHRWLGLPLAREPRPHVERWYAALKARAASQQVLSLPVT